MCEGPGITPSLARSCTRAHTSGVKPGHKSNISASTRTRAKVPLDRLLELHAKIQATRGIASLPRVLTRQSWPTRSRVLGRSFAARRVAS